MVRPTPLIRPPAALDLTITATTGKPFAHFVRTHLLAAHALLAPPLRELSVAFVGDKRMSELHLLFLNVPGPTDVLTFSLDANQRGRATAGEVVVCVPEATRQARRQLGRRKVTRRQTHDAVAREVLLYVLHGMLHLCGFDDKTDAGFRKMHRTEDDILTRLGVGPVFDPAATSRIPATRAPANRPARNRKGKEAR